MTGVVTIGGKTLQAKGTGDAFYVAGSVDRGTIEWAQVVGSDGNAWACRVAFDGAGDVIGSATLDGTTAFIGDDEYPIVGYDLAVVKFDPVGNLRASLVVTADGVQDVAGLAVHADGAITLTGGFILPTNFGGGELNNAGGVDMFVATYGP